MQLQELPLVFINLLRRGSVIMDVDMHAYCLYAVRCETLRVQLVCLLCLLPNAIVSGPSFLGSTNHRLRSSTGSKAKEMVRVQSPEAWQMQTLFGALRPHSL